MKKRLELTVTNKAKLKLKRGKKSLVVSGRRDLERPGHQALDLATTLSDLKR